MDELALTESRTLRAQYADRTDVLDKVKALALLPDGTHATTEIVAAYYEVPVETIKSVVEDNRDELKSNGRSVLSGSDLREFASPFGGLAKLGLSSKTRSLAVFSRRAILNVGTLLRESEIARQVRTYLLDVEADAASPKLGDDLLAELEVSNRRTTRAIEIAKAERARGDHFEQRTEIAEGRMRQIEGADGLTIRAFHKKYFSDVSERLFFEHLYAKGYLIDQRGKGSVRFDGTVRDGSQHRHPSFKGKPYLYLHFGGIHGDRRREYTRVRPGQPELDFKAVLVRQGLKPNDGDDGYLFALPDGA